MVILRRFCPLIFGVCLLLPTPALADSYIRVNQKGVIYYYFDNRESAGTPQKGGSAPKTPPDVWFQETSRLLPASGKAPIKPKPQVSLAVTPAPALPPLWQVLPTSNQRSGLSALIRPDHYGTPPKSRLTRLPFFDSPVALVLPLRPPEPEVGRDLAASPDPGIKIPDVRDSRLIPAEPRSVFMFPVSYKNEITPPFDAGQRQQPALCLKTVSQHIYSFPVAWPFTFRDTWGDPRSGDRLHQAVDIIAPEGTGVYAITNGVIQILGTYPRAGITIFMRGQDGRGYGYMHLQGYAPGMVEGKAVQAGELIGYVGRTGIFESAAHLHFEVYADPRFSKDSFLNPYTFLIQLCRGHGVTDLNQPKLARALPLPSRVNQIRVNQTKIKWIQGYRQPWSEAFSAQTARKTPVLEIKNYWE